MPEELRIADYEDAELYLKKKVVTMPSKAEQELMIQEWKENNVN